MPEPTQATRHIAIHTPLGADVLLLQKFSAREKISGLFNFDLDLFSENAHIKFDDIMGQNVTISMALPHGGTRYWNGFINRFEQGVSTSRKFAEYRATMVPWLWFLTLTSDCRIFQEKSVPEIIKQVFGDLGFSDIEDRLSPGYRKWTYCVQYRETHFNFISRLMEQEGIYYYFAHEKGKCTLVLCDSLSKHDPFDNYGQIPFTPDTKATALRECISDWAVAKQVLTGKFAHTDYNFEKPGTSLMSAEEDGRQHAGAGYEIYDYPGEYPEKSDGDKYARVRMEELVHCHEVCTGRSDCRGICPGYQFNLSQHTRQDQNRQYLVLSAEYQAAAQDYETSGGLEEMFACSFRVIPGSVQYRPERKTPKPVIQGTQTAVVTGPPGEEIHTNAYGQVKVQFHWDRQGKKDASSSCWIRVSQAWAGKGWGAVHIPHVGQEVVVDFLEGDPDRPIITGLVYNGNNMPARPLPDNKTQRAFQDHGGNRIIMEGGAGKEQIHMYSPHGESLFSIGAPENSCNEGLFASTEYDLTLNNDRDRREKTGGNRDVEVLGNYVNKVLGNHKKQIAKDLEEEIDGLKIEKIKKGLKQEINGKVDKTIFDDYQKTIKGKSENRYENGALRQHWGVVNDVFFGRMNYFCVGGKLFSTLGLQATFNAGLVIEKSKELRLFEDKAVKTDAKEKIELIAAKKMGPSKITLDKDKIEIKHGKTSIEIKKDGDIKIKSNGKVNVVSEGDALIQSNKGNVTLDGKKNVSVRRAGINHRHLCVER